MHSSLLVAVLVLGQLPDSATPQQTLRKHVLKLMEDYPPGVAPTRFSIDSIALYFEYGGLRGCLGETLDPLEVPASTQATVETIREMLDGWGPVSRKEFSYYLDRIEGVIEQELQVLTEFKGEERSRRIADYKRTTDAILKAAANHFAKKEHRHLAPHGAVMVYNNECDRWYYSMPMTYTVQPAVNVTVETVPAGGFVYYTPGILYLSSLTLNKNDHKKVEEDTDIWIEMVNKKLRICGPYYFRARWVDESGIERVKHAVRVPIRAIPGEDVFPITLRPDPLPPK